MGKFSRNTELDTPRFAMDFLVGNDRFLGMFYDFPIFSPSDMWPSPVLSTFKSSRRSINQAVFDAPPINYWALKMDCAQNSFEIYIYIGPLYTIIINGHDGWRLTLYRKTMVVPSSSNHEWNNGWVVVWNMTFIFQNIWDNPSHWLSYFSRWFKPPTSMALYNIPLHTIILHAIPLLSTSGFRSLSLNDQTNR